MNLFLTLSATIQHLSRIAVLPRAKKGLPLGTRQARKGDKRTAGTRSGNSMADRFDFVNTYENVANSDIFLTSYESVDKIYGKVENDKNS
jgi:hypothetical protein